MKWSSVMFMIVLLAVIQVSCETTPVPVEEPDSEVNLEELPKISEMLERFGPEQPTEASLPEPMAQPQAVYAVERIVLPLDVAMNPAWALVDESILSEPKRAVLHRNGIRIGTLPLSELSRFDQALARRGVTTRFRTAGSRRMEPLVRRPLKQQRALVELTMPPDIPQSYTMAGGSVQLLHQAIAGPGGSLSLRLLPHHHRITPTVRVRSHLDTRFDGRMFHELMMTLSPKPDELVVIGLYWPWQPTWVTVEPKPKPASESESGSNPEQPDEGESPLEPQSEPQEHPWGENVRIRKFNRPGIYSLEDLIQEREALRMQREREQGVSPDAPDAPDAPDGPGASDAPDDGDVKTDSDAAAMAAKQLIHVEPERLPPTLGATLFTGEQTGRPVQVIMLMRVVPLPQ